MGSSEWEKLLWLRKGRVFAMHLLMLPPPPPSDQIFGTAGAGGNKHMNYRLDFTFYKMFFFTKFYEIPLVYNSFE